MKEQENLGEKTSGINQGDSSIGLSLDRRYLYQSPTTGTASATSMTVKQLCRMFSPPASSTARFSAETQVLALLSDNTTYDPAGWRKATDVPVLRHACNSFYYTQNQAPQGPVSCRQLATLRFQTEQPLDPERDQVYGESTGNQWVLLKSIPDLEIALQSFHDLPAAATETAGTSATTNSNSQNYDVSEMTYQEDDKTPTTGEISDQKDEQEVQDELEAFLSSTDQMGPKGMPGSALGNDDDDDDDDEAYESDGGTKYVKDPRSGNWIHHSLAPPKQARAHPSQPPPNKKAKTQHDNNSNGQNATEKTKKKSKKAKFAARNAKNWIYITGLPPDTSEDELAKFFAKVGIIDLDPETQRPKIKLYRHKTDQDGAKAGTCKGDASICYARPESVELALQVLDEAPFRDVVSTGNANDSYRLHVERAKFEQHGDYTQRKRISQAQRKVAKLAAKQAMDWDDGEINGRLTGGLKGLRIIVLKGLFHPSDFGSEEEEDALLAELEKKVRATSEEYGPVEKITVFSKNPQGVVVVKFTQPGAASEAIKGWDGKAFSLGKGRQERQIQSSFWDGVEDFTVRDEAKEEEEMATRHDAFGDWIESHVEGELPEELRLRVEK